MDNIGLFLNFLKITIFRAAILENSQNEAFGHGIFLGDFGNLKITIYASKKKWFRRVWRGVNINPLYIPVYILQFPDAIGDGLETKT